MSKEVILKRLKIIEELKFELNVLKEQLEDLLMDDNDYQELQEHQEALREIARQQKSKVTGSSKYSSIQESIKEKRAEILENRQILAQELVDYYRETGSLEFKDADGNVKKLKFSVKLVN